MSDRWAGTCEAFADVDVQQLAEWVVETIPAPEWSKMADKSWRGWGDKFEPLAWDLTGRVYPGCIPHIGMFALEPGQIHPAHRDEQPPEWITRVHVPIITNPHAVVTMWDGPHSLVVGKAYRFNTMASHAVSNGGNTSRLHFVFDVRQ